MNTIEGYRHIDPTKCGEFEYRTWTQNAILELDERLRKAEEDFKAHIHHTVNQDHVSLPILPIEEPQPDPLAPWKSLQPGDRVLDTRNMAIEIVKNPFDGHFLRVVDDSKYGYHDIPSHSLKYLQILQTGPFSAEKCCPGMWVWVRDNRRTKKYEGWVTIISINKRLGVFTTLPDGSKHLLFRHDGTHENDEPFEEITLHFAPPEQPSALEVARNKIIRIQKHPQCTHAEYEAELTAILTEFKEAGR